MGGGTVPPHSEGESGQCHAQVYHMTILAVHANPTSNNSLCDKWC